MVIDKAEITTDINIASNACYRAVLFALIHFWSYFYFLEFATKYKCRNDSECPRQIYRNSHGLRRGVSVYEADELNVGSSRLIDQW